MTKNYEEMIEKIGKDELSKRINLCNKDLQSKLTSHSQNIFNELLGKEFDQHKVNSIMNSIININMLIKASSFIENGIINPDLAQKLDKNLKQSD